MCTHYFYNFYKKSYSRNVLNKKSHDYENKIQIQNLQYFQDLIIYNKLII